MKFYREKSSNFLFDDTKVSNIFIHDVLPLIPNSDYLKIYLYGLLHSTQTDIFITNEDIARDLNFKIEEVLAAWTFFEEMGVIEKKYVNENDTTNFDVYFLDLKKELFFSNEKTGELTNEKTKISENDSEDNANNINLSDKNSYASGGELSKGSSFVNTEENLKSGLRAKKSPKANVKKIVDEINKITGKTFSVTESKKLINYLDDFRDDPEILLEGYRYFKSKGRLPKIDLVIKEIYKWNNLGYISLDEIKEFIKNEAKENDEHKRIAYLLGMGGILTEPEINVFNVWLNEYKLSVDDIAFYAEKAAGISRKFNYVKKIIEADFTKSTDSKQKRKPKTKEEEKIFNREKELEKRRFNNQKLHDQRLDEIYEKSEEIKNVNSEIITLSINLGQMMVSKNGNKESEIEKLNKKINELEEKKGEILISLGYDKDYLDEIFTCKKCKDSGVLENGAACDCVI